MPAKTAKAAADAFVARIRQNTGCITRQPIHAIRQETSGELLSAAFAPFGRPALLRTVLEHERLLIELRCDFEIRAWQQGRGPFEAIQTGYAYQILDEEEAEILAFHWHPVGVSPVKTPHLHLSSRLGPHRTPAGTRFAVAGMHIPTGFVTLADVIRLLIIEFGVEPRRADWEAILRQHAE